MNKNNVVNQVNSTVDQVNNTVVNMVNSAVNSTVNSVTSAAAAAVVDPATALTPIDRSILERMPADAVLHPSRPPVTLNLPGRGGEPWLLVAVRGSKALLLERSRHQRMAVCPLKHLVEVPETPSELDQVAGRLALAFPGASVVFDYVEPGIG